LAASIQVSAHPVAPSLGTVDPIENLSAFSELTWYGQPAPTVTLPFLKSKISSEASAQYFLDQRALLREQGDRSLELRLG
jgi:hypothetical protein